MKMMVSRPVQNPESGPLWTDHAKRRSAERFPGVNIESIYASAKPLPRRGKMRARIKRACPVNAKKWMSHGFAGRYFKIAENRIVFVIQAPETVLTVFEIMPVANGKMAARGSGDEPAAAIRSEEFMRKQGLACKI